MLRRALLAPALLVLLTTAPVSARAACLDPEDPPVSLNAPTLTVDVTTPRPSYKRGERTVVDAKVTMLVPMKADGADVTVELRKGTAVLTRLHGRTDASGTVTLRVTLPKAAGPGALDAFATARLEAVPSYDCRGGLVYQYGERTVKPLLTLR